MEYFDSNGDAGLQLHWLHPTGGWGPVPGSNLSPRYGLATTTTTFDNTVAAPTEVTRTGYSNAAGIGPHHGLATSVTQDPAGLTLTSTTDYETPGSGWLRRTARTLPAGAATRVAYTYYGNTETRDNPCTPGSDPANQAGMLKTTTAADPDGAGGPENPIVREVVYDTAGRTVATRVVGDTGGPGDQGWHCTAYDTRGRVVEQTHPASPGGGGPGSLALGTAEVSEGLGTRVTSSFNVPANTRLVALVASDTGFGLGTQDATITGGGLTWTKVAERESMEGYAAAAIAWNPSAQDMTVTATMAANYQTQLVVLPVGGAEEVHGGATATASAASGVPSVDLTTTGAGSHVVAVSSDWNATGPGTPGPGQTMIDEYHAAGLMTGHTWRTTTPVATPGDQTMNLTGPAAQRYNLVAVEIRPAEASPTAGEAARTVPTATRWPATHRSPPSPIPPGPSPPPSTCWAEPSATSTCGG
ncbi:MAG: hypothetical protein ACRD0A_04985 [Acidimicrobiales bacterium]